MEVRVLALVRYTYLVGNTFLCFMGNSIFIKLEARSAYVQTVVLLCVSSFPSTVEIITEPREGIKLVKYFVYYFLYPEFAFN